jgi:hypothetical protein
MKTLMETYYKMVLNTNGIRVKKAYNKAIKQLMEDNKGWDIVSIDEVQILVSKNDNLSDFFEKLRNAKMMKI